MKRIILMIVCAALCIVNANAQYKFPAIDGSVMDEAYYPLSAVGRGLPVQVKIIYSRPLKKDRETFGTALAPYDKVWRVGANEQNEIKFYGPVTMGGKLIPAGNYGLFAIPEKDKWTIIISSQLDKWGLTYDQSKDIVRFPVPVKALDNVQESLAITFTPLTNGANMVIGWDKVAVEIPIIFN